MHHAPINLDRRAIMYAAGDPRWHAMLVFPQREVAAKAWLARREVYSFYPVRSEKRRIGGRQVERERKYIPGYLFAKFPREPMWHRLLCTLGKYEGGTFFRDVLRMQSTIPGVLHPETLKRLLDMRSTDDKIAEEWRVRNRIKAGDRVRISGGNWDGWEQEVVEVMGDNAVMPIKLLGRNLEVPLAMVEKVGD